MEDVVYGSMRFIYIWYQMLLSNLLYICALLYHKMEIFILITTFLITKVKCGYDYHMFENFPLNEQNFKSELQLVNILRVGKFRNHKIKLKIFPYV